MLFKVPVKGCRRGSVPTCCASSSRRLAASCTDIAMLCDGEYMGELKFDVIIYNKFKSDPNELGDNMKRIIDVTKTPIKRGVWLDESFTRPLAFRLAKLPYEGPPTWCDALTNASVDKWFEGIDDWFATGEFAKE
ncbi:hypothetical protein LB505_003768 [Fusarium chuoi]|nr:hypothetical protein LB505_003768 [Fusarium chuoi]